MSKKHYLYLTSDSKQNVYVGRRTIKENVDPFDDLEKYKGSHSDKNYVPEAKMIIHVSDDFDEIYDLERDLILYMKEIEPKLVNKSVPAKRNSGKTFSTFNIKVSPQTREKHRKNATGKKASPQTKKKMSEAHKGKPKNFTEAGIKKLKEDKIGAKNPAYKGEKIKWIHKQTNAKEYLTVLELRDKYDGLCETNLYAVKNKRVKSYKGWMLDN